MRVRVGSIYMFEPALIDLAHRITNLEAGEIVRVINLPSAPKANTMGQCHVERVQMFCDVESRRPIVRSLGFAGMVSTNSLTPALQIQKRRLK